MKIVEIVTFWPLSVKYVNDFCLKDNNVADIVKIIFYFYMISEKMKS
jgi:hypothetical protein